MAIHKIYSIHDSKVGAYNQPWFARAPGEAIRNFSDLCNDPQSMIFRHCADYTLFELGEFDDNAASIKMLAAPHALGNGLNYKKNPTDADRQTDFVTELNQKRAN